jgi:hypothetical protein
MLSAVRKSHLTDAPFARCLRAVAASSAALPDAGSAFAARSTAAEEITPVPSASHCCPRT